MPSTIVAWLAGSMAGRSWRELIVAGPYVVAGAILCIWAVAPLNALRIGEVRARTVGVDVDRAQWIILAGSSLLAASSVVLAGLVGFIGLIVPHIGRRLVGSDARVLLPACACIGATLCMAADAVCRWVVSPAELPIGVLLAFIGVPAFFVSLSARRACTMIELRDVGLEIGGRPLLEPLNARIAPGEFVAILGRNGVGKTTLLRAIAGLHRPARGSILVDGTDGRSSPRCSARSSPS